MAQITIFQRFLHVLGIHCWLKYDIDAVDGTRRVCLICGRIESSVLNRSLAEYYGYDHIMGGTQ